jgi:hypothetical protein
MASACNAWNNDRASLEKFNKFSFKIFIYKFDKFGFAELKVPARQGG